MDVLYFLKERTRLIRDYYEHAARPFNEIIRKIEAAEEPYIPPYSEDPEPAFLSEWIEADELLEVTGRCCISMLSASLQLYFKTWEHELRLTCRTEFKGYEIRSLEGIGSPSRLKPPIQNRYRHLNAGR